MTTAPELWIDRAALMDGDLGAPAIRAMARSGELHRLRRGRYAFGESWDVADDQERHRIRALELGVSLAGRAAISHESAALLHGIDLPGGAIQRVHVTWPASLGRRTTTNITPHRGRVDPTHLQTIGGVLLTSPARTVFDIACSATIERAISAADSALHQKFCSADRASRCSRRGQAGTGRVPSQANSRIRGRSCRKCGRINLPPTTGPDRTACTNAAVRDTRVDRESKSQSRFRVRAATDRSRIRWPNQIRPTTRTGADCGRRRIRREGSRRPHTGDRTPVRQSHLVRLESTRGDAEPLLCRFPARRLPRLDPGTSTIPSVSATCMSAAQQ